MINPIFEVERFVKDRKLDKQKFDEMQVCTNILEEMFEMLGYDVPKEERDWLMMDFMRFIDRQVEGCVARKKENHTDDDRIDALSDIRVFCIDATMKLGYEPKCTLNETAKEINSRKQDPEQAKNWKDGDKWQKDRNQDPSTLYKADYDKCKIKED